ncbi:MAG: PSD1 and planctomycete cytochrome C domain-containing protein [Vicinamibacterales bacterium]
MRFPTAAGLLLALGSTSAAIVVRAADTGSPGRVAVVGITGSPGTGASQTRARVTLPEAARRASRAGVAALALAPALSGSARAGSQAAAATQPDFFETKVRPILVNSCYDCHRDDASGGLRVDSREALLKGGKSGPAIVPGDPDGSLLVAAVRQTTKLKMPQGGKLDAGEIDALVAWVKAGAEWPTASTAALTPKAREFEIKPEHRAFWSFQPLHAPPAPAVSHASWPKSDIDRFVLARLEKEGLTPVAAADKLTLLRRATLDLTGVPPTPEEVDAFEKDASPDAFAKVVDRLLASPRYGETWGRLWLDVARYGEDDYRSLDPKGRGHNPYPNAYLYRDWVIKAINDDLPYDQFVRAQLAGDLLDESTRARTLPALGFLGLGPWYYDNGAVEITRADERHDRVDAVSRGLLGLTVGCARCHDHKYDPIAQKDYYAIAGVFANAVYHEYPLAPRSVVEEYDAAEKKIEKKEKLLGEFLKTESEQLAQTLAFQSAKYMQAAWRVTGKPKEEAYKVVEDQKLDFELFDRWLKFLAKPPKFYSDLKPWQELVARGGSEAEAKKLSEAFQTTLVDLVFDKREVQDENEIIKAKALTGTKKKEPANKPNEFITNDDFCPGCGLELKSLPIERTNLWTDVFQRDLQEGFDPAYAEKVRPGLLVFRGWGLERQLSAERRTYIDGLRQDVEKARKALPKHYAYAHGVREAEKPANLQVNLRGNPFRLGDEVPRRFLAVLGGETPTPFTSGSGRLELANAIIEHPLSSRVLVNRVWKAHFGAGIVDTASNFGQAGERPTNPELLEYVAQRFVQGGRSLKALHREIMLSAVYQLSSDHSPQNFDKDSGNRLYWRANRRRLTAEQIRDSMLAVAGTLDEKIGGPSIELTPFVDRRTVYGRVSRYKLDEYLQLFDFPSPALSAEQRFTTNVPLQRLFFMNSDFMQRMGELLAARTAEEPDTPARVRKAYSILFGRAATEPEIQAGVEYLTTEPMREYEERKADGAKAASPARPEAGKDRGKASGSKGTMPAPPAPTAAQESASTALESATREGAMTVDDMSGDGMLAGVVPAKDKKDEGKKLPPVTAWGRYARVLMSSAEFLFIR